MIKRKKITALILALTVATSSLSVGASDFDALDSDTAVAGASEALSKFFAENTDAARNIAELLYPLSTIMDPDAVAGADEVLNSEEVIYDKEKKGIVKAESMLNVRKSATTLSDTVGSFVRGADITVVGEKLVNGNIWYKVRKGKSTGYVAGNYVVFGEEAKKFAKQIKEESKDPLEMPKTFKIPDDISALPQEVQDTLKNCENEVRYCFESGFEEAKKKKDFVSMYSVLVYLLENLQQIQDISNEYGLSATYALSVEDIAIVERNRANLSDTTGQSEDQFINNIVAASESASIAAASELAEIEAASRSEEERIRNSEAAELQAQAAEASRQAAEAASIAAAEQANQIAQAAAAAASRQAEEAARQAEEAARQATQPAPAPTAPSAEGHTATGDAIIAYASQFVGTLPYVWGGSSLTGGADCSGFCSQIFAHFGLLDQSAADFHAYCSGDMRGLGREVSVSEMQPGDLVCYNGHVALYAGNGQIVHEPGVGRYCEFGYVFSAPIITVRRLV